MDSVSDSDSEDFRSYLNTSTKIIETGNIPDEDKYLLADGSLFVMPSGFQKYYLHKIPKSDRECGGRISLTFRKYKNPV